MNQEQKDTLENEQLRPDQAANPTSDKKRGGFRNYALIGVLGLSFTVVILVSGKEKVIHDNIPAPTSKEAKLGNDDRLDSSIISNLEADYKKTEVSGGTPVGLTNGQPVPNFDGGGPTTPPNNSDSLNSQPPASVGFPNSTTEIPPPLQQQSLDNNEASVLEQALKETPSVLVVSNTGTRRGSKPESQAVPPGTRIKAFLKDQVTAIPNSSVEVATLEPIVTASKSFPKGTRILGTVVREQGDRIFVEFTYAIVTGDSIPTPIFAVIKDTDGADGIKGFRKRRINWGPITNKAISFGLGMVPFGANALPSIGNFGTGLSDSTGFEGFPTNGRKTQPLSARRNQTVTILFLEKQEQSRNPGFGISNETPFPSVPSYPSGPFISNQHPFITAAQPYPTYQYPPNQPQPMNGQVPLQPSVFPSQQFVPTTPPLFEKKAP